MVFLVINLISIAFVALGSRIGFDDASLALKEGVFSATSVIGYSISKSIFLYSIYLFVIALSAFAYIKFVRKVPISEVSIPSENLIFKKIEWGTVVATVILFTFFAFVLREKIFDQNSLYSEEFYNLSAINELRAEKFDIIYPYSVGNLLILNILSKFGIGFIFYKILLNSIALVAIYGSIAYFLKNIYKRLLVYFWLVILYLQSILSPSFHRNILRYFLPVFFVLVVTYVIYNKKRLISNFILLTSSIFLVLFFGSADNIVICSVLYFVAFVINFINTMSWKNSLIFMLSPIISVMLMFLIFSTKYYLIFLNQIKSITFYSGHANSVPFFNLYSFFSPSGLGDAVKKLVYAPAYYLPIILLGCLVIYIIINFKRFGLRNPVFGLLVLFTIAYGILFRQNFGDAGVGRIAITSTVLFFAVLAVYKLHSEQPSFVIVRLGFIFFFIITAIGLYFFRYNLDYYVTNYSREQNQEKFVQCNSVKNFGEKLVKAGFVLCESSILNEISNLESSLGSRNFYIFDDTFSLYYLLGRRPVVLIPAFYMAHDKQAILVDKMKRDDVKALVYPVNKHFFGVPSFIIGEKKFMTYINDYRDEIFKKRIELKNYDLYLR